MNKYQIHFAPMQGYTDYAYRKLHEELYGGVDCYYTPFIRIEKGQPRRQDMAKLQDRAYVDADMTVPQIIFGSVEEFVTLSNALKDLGYKNIDLNLGCPFPMQTSRGRGAAMITNTDVMDQVATLINNDHSVEYSVKMRLGLTSDLEWQSIISILNTMRLKHIVLHPRTASDMYAGALHEQQVAPFLAESKSPVIWNGDIREPHDIDRIFAKYPSLTGVMIGRGMLARPSMAIEWREGREWTKVERIEYLMKMHESLYQAYSATLCGPAQILQKIKTYWEYLEPEIGHKAYKTIRKASTIQRYNEAVSRLRSLIE